jgi:FKBP-type peptidyl-prolyl cis-trans isomerase
MRRRPSPVAAGARWSVPLTMALLACATDPPPRAPETDDERTSYAIGLHLGNRLRLMRTEVDPERIIEGLAAGMRERGEVGLDLDADLVRLELGRLGEAGSAAAKEARAAAARQNQQTGKSFLAENRTRPGVIELASGVQYRILSEGDGPPPALTDRITVEYEGRLLDSAVFDTSNDRFAPTIVRLNRTPDAWREVLPRVERGASVEVWVPGELDAAEHPGGLVPPGEVVVFTIRVTAIDRRHNPDVARAPP